MTGRSPARKHVVRIVGGAAALLLAGSAATAYAEDGAAGRGGDGKGLTVDGRFAPASAFVPPGAVSYDADLVPAGSWVRVQQRSDAKGTTVTLKVRGLKPGHAFGVHVHEKPCGVDPEAAGPHYQHVEDPKLVNPDNEVWLDLTTDRNGDAGTSSHHTWGLPEGAANSVVLHREPGGAGERVGCFTVPFGDFRTGVK